jgi:2-polyprenyl-3-methyl-5-hydroxy-6-metoxy-1,4-benzoquinol methylase
MFRANNDRIDFSALGNRVSIEIAKIAVQRAAGKTARLDVKSPQRSQEKIVNDVPRYRQVLRGVKQWLWAIRYIRGAFDRANRALEGVARNEQRLDKVNERLDRVNERCDGLLDRVSERCDGLNDRVAALAVGSDRVLAALEATAVEVAGVKREIMFQQRRLTRLVLPAEEAQKRESITAVADQRLDALYVAFEDVFRGSRADIKARLELYLERLDLAGASLPDRPVLDIGCGRGEWLELLGEKHIPSYGIDVNSMMIERAVSLGLDARHSDLLDHLRGVEDASRSAVTAFHVVEHLPLGTLIDFLDEALRVLVPGGVLILETPNPETMRVGATTFYNDPTHRNPIPPAVLQFLVEHRGFEEVEVVKLHPFTQGLLEAGTRDAQLLNRVLFGPQDYSIIARRG